MNKYSAKLDEFLVKLGSSKNPVICVAAKGFKNKSVSTTFAFTYLHSSSPASSGAQSSRGPEKTTSPTHVSFWRVRDGGALGRRLEHNATNVVYALGDSFAGSADGDSSLCRVG